ncbi:MAG: hypothetical protein HKN22_06810 [Bacteroidia bacterium]|nr:hypothetical protein [Bacteroidia bacterium]
MGINILYFRKVIRGLRYGISVLIISALFACGGSQKTGSRTDSQNYLNHKVIVGDTPATLVEKYRMSIEDIRSANGGKLPALDPGVIIIIPKDKIGSLASQIKDPNDPMFEQESDTTEVLTMDEIDMSIILPFYLEYNSKLISRNSSPTDPTDFLVHEKSIPALQFFEGAKIAQKELELEGISVNLNAYDTENDKVSLAELLNSEDVKKSHLLIGSFGTDKNEEAVNITKTNGNDLVITKSYRANYIDNNDHVIIAHPSGIRQCKMMAEYLKNKFEGENIIIVHQESNKEENLAGIFKSILVNHKSWSVPEYNEEKLYLEAFQKKLSGLETQLESGKKNVVVITSSSEFLVSRVLTKLYTYKGQYDIVVSGLPTWQNFQSLDVDILQELKVHYFTTAYLDKSNPLFIRFRKMYVRSYFTEPGPDAFDGYCMVKYLARSMHSKGSDFRSDLLLGIKDFSKQTMNYHYVEDGGGLENRSFFILKFEDYDLRTLNF